MHGFVFEIIACFSVSNHLRCVACFIFYRLTLLTRDIDIPILSVRLSVRDTLVLYENGSIYRHIFFTIR